MAEARDVLTLAEAAERLSVSRSRISQLLKETCAFADAPVFELESPEGHPVGTTHVTNRTITLASVAAYEVRHPWSTSGKRRRKHPSVGGPGTMPSSGAWPTATGVQVLRLELEHQLGLNRELREALEEHQQATVERVRALKHHIVDLEADLEHTAIGAESIESKLSMLQAAFDAYGEVFTQDVGPQHPAGA